MNQSEQIYEIDCEQSLSSPNSSEKLARRLRHEIPHRFTVILHNSFISTRVGSEEDRTTARSLYMKQVPRAGKRVQASYVWF